MKTHESFWDRSVIFSLLFFVLCFITPISTYINTTFGYVGEIANKTETLAENITESFDLDRALKKGDFVGKFEVTSVIGDPREGGSRTHAGTDLAMPVGTQLKVPDNPRNEVVVNCVSYKYDYKSQKGGAGDVEYEVNFITSYQVKIRVLHLSKMVCSPGQTRKLNGLAVFGLSGAVYAPHTHVEYYIKENESWVLKELPFDVAHAMIIGAIKTPTLKEKVEK